MVSNYSITFSRSHRVFASIRLYFQILLDSAGRPAGDLAFAKLEWVQPEFPSFPAEGDKPLFYQCRPCLLCPQSWVCAQRPGAASPRYPPGIWFQTKWGFIHIERHSVSSGLAGRCHSGGNAKENMGRIFLCVAECWWVHLPLQRTQQRKSLMWKIGGFS